VLRHHPDKRKAAGEKVSQDDDYFTNITKAWETLGNATARRAFDSIDPEFDDDLPSTADVNKKGFFNVSNFVCTGNFLLFLTIASIFRLLDLFLRETKFGLKIDLCLV
jgi:DnaJ-class molecular chaperone